MTIKVANFRLLAAAIALPSMAATLSIYPPELKLAGHNASQVVAVSSGERDVTADCRFQIADSALATVSKEGMVTAAVDGASTLTATCGTAKVTAPITITSASEEPKLSFVKDVVPIFTMAGCAGSNCHGSIRGQKGFKLSLFGYEPTLDYTAIQPRIDKDNPENSLLLKKPTFQIQHGGGVRFAVGSLEYRTILDWIRGGATYDSTGSPRIASLTVYPTERTLEGPGATQQLIATARYTDGTFRDVTHLVQYTSNNPDTVQVSPDGKVKALQTGETAVMVRTLGQAVATKIYVPQPGNPHAAAMPPANNYIDQHVFDKLERMHLEPSGLSTDEQFLRRVYLDTIGLLPTSAEAEAFLQSKDPAKRANLIGELLKRPEFSEFWAMKFTELFRAGTREAGPKSARYIYEYVRKSLEDDKPYDKLVTELLLSQGPDMFSIGGFWNVTFDSNAPDHATNISQIFLGTRIECAKCHNHPYEKWTQDDFYGFAAFFSRVAIKEIHENDENEHFYAEEGKVVNPKTKEPAVAKYLDGGFEPDDPDKDIRVPLAKWMTSPDNRFFSRAITNRIWKHFMGRGLVEDVDDFRITNPPSNPALLDAMAKDLSSNGYDLRRLIGAILNSRTYQLSAEPNDSNRKDTLNYSHYYMKRMIVEQMMDTIAEVTGVPDKFAGYPPGTRAMQVYTAGGAGRGSYMLATFGRPNRDTICERDPVQDIVQTLHLISGDTINAKIAKWKPDANLSDDRQLDRVFLTALTRFPNADERARVAVDLRTKNRVQVYQDVLWALLNSKEFMYNH